MTPLEFPRETAAPRSHDFNTSYAGTPPWDIGRPQEPFVELADAGKLNPPVLDCGCGTGELALMAAARGYEAVGIDSASAAIDIARRKAAERNLAVELVVGDALDLASLGRQFPTVLDSGVFHVFDDEERTTYVDSLASVMPSGGHLYLLCFSDKVPGGFGPRRISERELTESFAEGWKIDSIVLSRMDVTFTPAGVPAWFASITRL